MRALAGLVESAGHLVDAESPQVVLADESVGLNGDGLPRVVISGEDGEGSEEEGAAGWLPDPPSPAQLDAALRAAVSGLAVRPRAPRPNGRARGFRAAVETPPLTPRELDILGALGDGLSNKEVARRLGISAHTVKFHLETIFRKLDAASRAEAVVKGLRSGAIEL